MHKPTYEELVEENKMLRHKLSPLEDKEYTAFLSALMAKHDLTQFKREFRDGEYIMLYPKELYKLLTGEEGNTRDITEVGRSLQAMLWERSALGGNLCFVMEASEYERTRK